jgi:hypothetical protein
MESSLTREHISASTSQKWKYPDWQREFEGALSESDPQTLRKRVDAAESAIFLRLQSVLDDEERRAIDDAIKALRAIQKDKLGYPDWNKR